MNLSEKVALRLLSNLDPEKAHNLAMRALKFGLIPKTQGFQQRSDSALRHLHAQRRPSYLPRHVSGLILLAATQQQPSEVSFYQARLDLLGLAPALYQAES